MLKAYEFNNALSCMRQAFRVTGERRSVSLSLARAWSRQWLGISNPGKFNPKAIVKASRATLAATLRAVSITWDSALEITRDNDATRR